MNLLMSVFFGLGGVICFGIHQSRNKVPFEPANILLSIGFLLGALLCGVLFAISYQTL